jgi:hypothetical protein
MTKKILGLIVQMVIGGINYNFSGAEQRNVSNYGQIIRANCRQSWKLFMLYLTAIFGHQLQLLVKLERNLFHVFLSTYFYR